MLDKEKYFKLFEKKDWENVVTNITEDFRHLFIELLEYKKVAFDKEKSLSYMISKCIPYYEEFDNILLYLNTIFENEKNVIDRINELLDIYSIIYKKYKKIKQENV